jgi:hypothetical protein
VDIAEFDLKSVWNDDVVLALEGIVQVWVIQYDCIIISIFITCLVLVMKLGGAVRCH